MADKTSPAAADPVRFDSVPLLANSYDFAELLKASAHAESLKTSEGQTKVLLGIPEELAINQDVIAGQRDPALPEGTELEVITNEAGQEAPAAVTVPGKDPAETPAPTKN